MGTFGLRPGGSGRFLVRVDGAAAVDDFLHDSLSRSVCICASGAFAPVHDTELGGRTTGAEKPRSPASSSPSPSVIPRASPGARLRRALETLAVLGRVSLARKGSIARRPEG